MTIEENKISIEVIKSKITRIGEDLKTFVTLDRFNPIEKIVWALVVLVLTSIVGAGLSLILK